MSGVNTKQKKGPQKLSDHSYPAVSNTTRGASKELDFGGLFTPSTETPSSSPASKKPKADLSLHELQENIITALNKRADSLEEMIKTNSNTIEELKSSLLFVNAEIVDLQKSKVELTAKVTEQARAISQLENRVIDVERYKRRWCLRLYGVPEAVSENVKVKVTEICKGVAPKLEAKMSEAVDVAQRLGRPMSGRARAIIILFALRERLYLEKCKKQRLPQRTQTTLWRRPDKRRKGVPYTALALRTKSTQRRKKGLRHRIKSIR